MRWLYNRLVDVWYGLKVGTEAILEFSADLTFWVIVVAIALSLPAFAAAALIAATR